MLLTFVMSALYFVMFAGIWGRHLCFVREGCAAVVPKQGAD